MLHQAVSVVDWCRASITNCQLQHNGNAVWFGNKCEVQMKRCNVSDTLAAFSLRTTWDRGSKCLCKEQDTDDGGLTCFTIAKVLALPVQNYKY